MPEYPTNKDNEQSLLVKLVKNTNDIASVNSGADDPGGAADTGYDNTDSGITATTVQEAIDEAFQELEARLESVEASSLDGQVVVFDGTTGNKGKKSTVSGIGKLTGGVLTQAVAGTDIVVPGATTTSGLTMATARVLGRTTSNTGAIEELSVGAGLSLSAGSLAIKTGDNVRHFMWSFNPKAVCDGTIDRLFLMTVGPDFPNGMVISRWNLSFDADPATEVDLDFKRADAFIGVANAAVMDVLDTTNGASSETTAGNINSGATVANGKVLYLEFGTAYTVDNLQIVFEFWCTAA